MGHWELHKSEPVDASNSNEAQYLNKSHSIHVRTSDIVPPYNIKYFAKTFSIINPRALCIDQSGFSIWILDNHDHMFCWNNMEYDMEYMESSLIEGFTNYFFKPEDI
ncbi:hypothetical protein C1645_838841 [Glomus cerebriforme]|uniref:Uncharacterized protein n=1 Tax=Glomus cerebriforme TaxID=658196 RepID=A0A397S6I8_9GLOM|nr:hypothetical protein C1645_838841 [Glomus cerebriforme]